eukprot:756199-Hanusia_phi.AAC.3
MRTWTRQLFAWGKQRCCTRGNRSLTCASEGISAAFRREKLRSFVSWSPRFVATCQHNSSVLTQHAQATYEDVVQRGDGETGRGDLGSEVEGSLIPPLQVNGVVQVGPGGLEQQAGGAPGGHYYPGLRALVRW